MDFAEAFKTADTKSRQGALRPLYLFSDSKPKNPSINTCSNSLTYSPKRKITRFSSTMRNVFSSKSSVKSVSQYSPDNIDVDVEVDQIALVDDKQLRKITDNLSRLCDDLGVNEEEDFSGNATKAPKSEIEKPAPQVVSLRPPVDLGKI